MVSTSSLSSFLIRFQSYIDELQGTPSNPTYAEKVATMLDAVHPSRCFVITHALKRSAANDLPDYAELKHKLMDLDHQDPIEKNSVALTKVNMTSSTTINEVYTDNITSYNPVYSNPKMGQCSMCTKMKLSYLNGCSNIGML